jgi:hypothetical protein
LRYPEPGYSTVIRGAVCDTNPPRPVSYRTYLHAGDLRGTLVLPLCHRLCCIDMMSPAPGSQEEGKRKRRRAPSISRYPPRPAPPFRSIAAAEYPRQVWCGRSVLHSSRRRRAHYLGPRPDTLQNPGQISTEGTVRGWANSVAGRTPRLVVPLYACEEWALVASCL